MSDTNGSGGDGTPVELGPKPAAIEGRRVLGIVPGLPVAGERKEPQKDRLVMVWPHLLVRHAVASMAVIFLVLLLAVLFDAPLTEVANPTVTPNPEKAPWYFAGLQELLAHFHPLIAGVLIPGSILIGLAALPYIDRSLFIQARHRRVAVTTFTTFAVIMLLLTIVGFAFRGPNWGWVWPWQEWHGKF